MFSWSICCTDTFPVHINGRIVIVVMFLKPHTLTEVGGWQHAAHYCLCVAYMHVWLLMHYKCRCSTVRPIYSKIVGDQLTLFRCLWLRSDNTRVEAEGAVMGGSGGCCGVRLMADSANSFTDFNKPHLSWTSPHIPESAHSVQLRVKEAVSSLLVSACSALNIVLLKLRLLPP